MTVQYKLEYDEDGARQVANASSREITAAPRVHDQSSKKRRRRRLPSSVHTALTVGVCGLIFFGAVAYAPKGWRPQDFTGAYVSDVSGDVKASEADVQAPLEAYTAQLRIAAEQQNNRMRAVTEGITRAYTAAYDLNRLQTEAANQMRGALAGQQMAQTAQANAPNVEIASISELVGQGLNYLEPGSGASALRAAEEQRKIAADRMKDTAVQSAQTNPSPYVSKLPDPAEIARALNSVPAMEIPAPPHFKTAHR